MFLRRFTDFVLQGRVQAMAVAFLFAYIPFLGVVSILIAALVTLRIGILDGLLVTLAATFPYFLMYAVHPAPSEIVLIAILVACNVLTWSFAILLKRYSNWSLVFDLALVLGVIAVGLVHLIYPNVQTWWGAHLTTYLNQSMDSMTQLQPDKSQASSQEMIAETVKVVKRYASGFLAISILFNALMQLAIARWWQAAMFNPGGLRKELYQIRLSLMTGFLFVAGIIFSYLGNATALDIMPVLMGVYCIAGLCLLHNIFSLSKLGWLWLLIVYVGIILSFPLGVMLVAIIALLDSSFDFRKRLHV